ncbi:hypothetical protein THAOC_15863 [Thalassiosira oceanica]|uniref:Uncharacterized protein n=1 Tax=Thalassiosira oceanica TaxID=159749 RepID=K0SQX3_THAOC|nr:hypothetical protein THAOC_15863 [Thalassiosira oceanica]|eukprot:EJK63471.1 hypothetical protein THAOC_15863 [Thalassiosira oceanica]
MRSRRQETLETKREQTRTDGRPPGPACSLLSRAQLRDEGWERIDGTLRRRAVPKALDRASTGFPITLFYAMARRAVQTSSKPNGNIAIGAACFALNLVSNHKHTVVLGPIRAYAPACSMQRWLNRLGAMTKLLSSAQARTLDSSARFAREKYFSHFLYLLAKARVRFSLRRLRLALACFPGEQLCHLARIILRTKHGRSAEREGTKMLGSIVEDHRTIDLDVKWHGEFDGATLKGRYSTGKKLRTKARDRANCDLAVRSNEAMAVFGTRTSDPLSPSFFGRDAPTMPRVAEGGRGGGRGGGRRRGKGTQVGKKRHLARKATLNPTIPTTRTLDNGASTKKKYKKKGRVETGLLEQAAREVIRAKKANGNRVIVSLADELNGLEDVNSLTA